jgi:hypothetical protein
MASQAMTSLAVGFARVMLEDQFDQWTVTRSKVVVIAAKE